MFWFLRMGFIENICFIIYYYWISIGYVGDDVIIYGDILESIFLLVVG